MIAHSTDLWGREADRDCQGAAEADAVADHLVLDDDPPLGHAACFARSVIS